MGNHIGVDKKPIPLSDVLDLATFKEDPAKLKLNNKNYKTFYSCLHLWHFYQDNENPKKTHANAVTFSNFKSFDQTHCYLALHIYISNQTHTDLSLPESPCNTIVKSCEEALTPRGLANCCGNLLEGPFITASNSPPTNDSKSTLHHNIYIWNGKKSEKLIKAIALAKSFELDHALKNEEKDICRFLFYRSDMIPLSSIFPHDTTFDAQETKHYVQTNHLYRLLITNRRSNDNSESNNTTITNTIKMIDTNSASSKLSKHSAKRHTVTNGTTTTNHFKNGSSKRKSSSAHGAKEFTAFKNIFNSTTTADTTENNNNKNNDKDSDSEMDEDTPPTTKSKKKKQLKKIPPLKLNNVNPITSAKDSADNTTSSSSEYSSSHSPIKSSAGSSNTTTPTKVKKMSIPIPPLSFDSPSAESHQHRKSPQKKDQKNSTSTSTSSTSSASKFSLPKIDAQKIDQAAQPVQPEAIDHSNSENIIKTRKLKYFDDICSQITDDLFLGSQTVSQKKDLLQKNGITHILNCAASICPVYFPDEFNYRALFLMDGVSEDITILLYDIIQWIEEALQNKGKVLIHCQQGVSRSSAMMIGYLMWKWGWDYEKTQGFVKEKRGVSSPNAGFICQLLRLSKRFNPASGQVSPRLHKIVSHAKQDPEFLVGKRGTKIDFTLENPAAMAPKCFILQTIDTLFIWVGSEAGAKKLQTAKDTVQRIQLFEKGSPTNVQIINQGEETMQFLDGLLVV